MLTHELYTMHDVIAEGMSVICLACVQAYFNKSSAKINHLRVDSLAMLLSLANIGSHAKVSPEELQKLVHTIVDCSLSSKTARSC